MSGMLALTERLRGLRAAGRDAEVSRLLHEQASAGDADAQFLLGDAYWRGASVPQNLSRGRELFMIASRRGHPMAMRAYTNLLASGIAGTRDWELAMTRLRQEAADDPLRARMLALIGAMAARGAIDRWGHPAGPPPRAEVMNEDPQLVMHRGVLTADECDFLREAGSFAFVRSKVEDGTGGGILHDGRTSEDANIHWLIEDPAIHAINRRLAWASGTRYDQAEPLLILRYRVGQSFTLHTDPIEGEANQRRRTVLTWLNTGYQGGMTAFPRLGIELRGQPGDVLAFDLLHADGSTNMQAEHAGMPVTEGVKYLATRWVRQRRHLPNT